MFEYIGLGQKRSCQMASVFLDLTDFTGRTFWDDSGEVADLAHAVLSGFAHLVQSLGGHVLGLRGDGIFAGFGPHPDPELSVALAATACAASLSAVEHSLNPELERRGIARVQARAGCDYGETVFVRTGTPQASEVNVIGFATNFAAKCEKRALSWETVVGEGFAAHIPGSGILRPHEKSPKTYQRDGERRAYKFYDYNWRPMVAEVDSTVTELAELGMAWRSRA